MHVSLNTSGTGWDVRAKEAVVWQNRETWRRLHGGCSVGQQLWASSRLIMVVSTSSSSLTCIQQMSRACQPCGGPCPGLQKGRDTPTYRDVNTDSSPLPFFLLFLLSPCSSPTGRQLQNPSLPPLPPALSCCFSCWTSSHLTGCGHVVSLSLSLSFPHTVVLAPLGEEEGVY